MKIRPGTDWATAPRTSPSCDTWRSTSCKRTQPRDLCAGSSSAPAGTTPTSPVCSPYSEVRLPWQDLYTDNPGAAGQSTYQALLALGKPTALTEFGSGSPASGDPSFSMPTLISQIQADMPDTVYWLQW